MEFHFSGTTEEFNTLLTTLKWESSKSKIEPPVTTTTPNTSRFFSDKVICNPELVKPTAKEESEEVKVKTVTHPHGKRCDIYIGDNLFKSYVSQQHAAKALWVTSATISLAKKHGYTIKKMYTCK